MKGSQLLAVMVFAAFVANGARADPIYDEWSRPIESGIWYKLQPSFVQDGPWIFVHFEKLGRAVDPDGTGPLPPSPAWSATRLSIYWDPNDDSRDPQSVREVTDSDACPAILGVLHRAGPALSTRIDLDPRRSLEGIYDGTIVTAGALGRLMPDNALGTVAVSGNSDTRVWAWAIEAEAWLKACWRPAN